MDVGKVTDAANTQNKGNVAEQQTANRVGQTDTAGNRSQWYQTGVDAQGNPIWAQSTSLGNLGQEFQTGFAGLGQQYTDLAGHFAGMAAPNSQAAFGQAYDAATAMSGPQQQRAQAAMDTQLRNQGLVPGTAAYDNAMLDLRNSQSQQNNTLMAQIQNQLYNQGLSGLQQQEQSLGLLQPGIAYGASTTQGNFSNVPGISVPNVDIAGLNEAKYQQATDAYKAQMQSYGAGLGGLASLGGTLGGAVIKNPESIGELASYLPFMAL